MQEAKVIEHFNKKRAALKEQAACFFKLVYEGWSTTYARGRAKISAYDHRALKELEPLYKEIHELGVRIAIDKKRTPWTRKIK